MAHWRRLLWQFWTKKPKTMTYFSRFRTQNHFLSIAYFSKCNKHQQCRTNHDSGPTTTSLNGKRFLERHLKNSNRLLTSQNFCRRLLQQFWTQNNSRLLSQWTDDNFVNDLVQKTTWTTSDWHRLLTVDTEFLNNGGHKATYDVLTRVGQTPTKRLFESSHDDGNNDFFNNVGQKTSSVRNPSDPEHLVSKVPWNAGSP